MINERRLASGIIGPVQDLGLEEQRIVFERTKIAPDYLRIQTGKIFAHFGWRLKDDPVTVHAKGYEKLNMSAVAITQDSQELPVLTQVYHEVRFGRQRLMSVLSAIKKVEEAGVPVPRIYNPLKGGTHVEMRSEPAHPHKTDPLIYAVAMEYFDGEDFTKREATDDDIKNVFTFLPKIHGVKFPTNYVYDSWSPLNLVAESEKCLDKLNPKTVDAIEPVIEEVKTLDTSTLETGLCHGDVHRSHVLKNEAGDYRIIDWSLVTNAPLAFDIGTTFANWCVVPDNLTESQRLVGLALDAYTKLRPLSDTEITASLLFMEATLAMFLMRARTEQIVNQDMSEQTAEWASFAELRLRVARRLRESGLNLLR